MITKNIRIGTILSLDRKRYIEVKADNNGVFLWGKSVMFCNKGDELLAMATDPVII